MEPQTAVQNQPENARIEDARNKLYFLYKVDKGLEQANSGQKVSHEEARQRLQEWLG